MKTTKTPNLDEMIRTELSYRIQLHLTSQSKSLKDVAELACVAESSINKALKRLPISKSALLGLCRILEIDESELSEPPYDEKLFYRLMNIMDAHIGGGYTDAEIENLWTELRASYSQEEIYRDNQWLRYLFSNTKSKTPDPNEKLAIDQMCEDLLALTPLL